MAATTRPAITRMRYALDRGANSLSVSSTAIGIAAHSPLSDELFRRDRQVTNPFANRMKDRIGDRCGDAGIADELVDPPARCLHRMAGLGKVSIEEEYQIVRQLLFGGLIEGPEVSEQNHDLAL